MVVRRWNPVSTVGYWKYVMGYLSQYLLSNYPVSRQIKEVLSKTSMARAVFNAKKNYIQFWSWKLCFLDNRNSSLISLPVPAYPPPHTHTRSNYSLHTKGSDGKKILKNFQSQREKYSKPLNLGMNIDFVIDIISELSLFTPNSLRKIMLYCQESTVECIVSQESSYGVW